MKKQLLFLLFSSVISLASFSQVPNGGFESWVPFGIVQVPQDWKTTDSLSSTNEVSQPSVTQEITDVHSGAFSLRLRSWTYYIPGPIAFIQGLPGCATNGDVDADLTNLIINPVKGTPDTVSHAVLSGYYKYSPMLSDTGSIEIALFRRNTTTGNRDTVAMGIYKTTTQNTYTQFNIVLDRLLAGSPDSMLIWIQSSPRSPIAPGNGPGEDGSVLLVDSLSFSGTIGIDERNDLVKSVSLYPIPASKDLNIVVELKKQMRLNAEVFDINGKLSLSAKINSAHEVLDISGLAEGNYSVRLTDEHNVSVYKTRFTVSR